MKQRRWWSADQPGSEATGVNKTVRRLSLSFLTLDSMVRCFLIHTICPVSALGPGESRVLYSRVFGPNEAIFSHQHQDLSPEERRLLQKEKVAVVARFEVSAFVLFKNTSSHVYLWGKHDLQGQLPRFCSDSWEIVINEK